MEPFTFVVLSTIFVTVTVYGSLIGASVLIDNVGKETKKVKED